MGIYWCTEMDSIREMDIYLFADSQLNSTPDFTTSGSSIHLFSNAAHLSPGQVLEPQGDVITALKEGVILTLVTFRGARDSRLHVSVWGQPYTVSERRTRIV